MNEYDKTIQELWRGVILHYVSASNSINMAAVIDWADYAVAEYKKRFPKPEPPAVEHDPVVVPIDGLTGPDRADIVGALRMFANNLCRTADCRTRCGQLITKLNDLGKRIEPDQDDVEASFYNHNPRKGSVGRWHD